MAAGAKDNDSDDSPDVAGGGNINQQRAAFQEKLEKIRRQKEQMKGNEEAKDSNMSEPNHISPQIAQPGQ